VNRHGRRCCRANRYRVVRRAKNQVISFGRLDILARFGTEGSVVRIHSPRPNFLRELAEFSRIGHSVSPECPFLRPPFSQVSMPPNTVMAENR
jgi:hypothetical protein